MSVATAIVVAVAVLVLGVILIALIVFGFIRKASSAVIGAYKQPSSKAVEAIQQELEQLRERVTVVEEELSKVPHRAG